MFNTNKFYKEIVLIRTMTEFSRKNTTPFDQALFEKAYAKARRWMNRAYESEVVEEFINERGGSILSWYEEEAFYASQKEVTHG